MGGIRLHLSGVGALQTTDIASVLNQCHVHSQTNAQEGNALLAGVPHGFDLALNTAVAKAAGHQNRIQMRE